MPHNNRNQKKEPETDPVLESEFEPEELEVDRQTGKLVAPPAPDGTARRVDLRRREPATTEEPSAAGAAQWWHDAGHGATQERETAQRTRDETAGFGQPAVTLPANDEEPV